jgi:hypothetical protein
VRRIPVALSVGVLLTLASAAVIAQDSAEPVSCLVMTRVRDIKVVDDDRVLFYQRGGRIYLNTLERTCARLKFSGSFVWRGSRGIQNTRLCSSDWIIVVERRRSGSACELGPFQLISEEQVQQLLPSEPGTSEH